MTGWTVRRSQESSHHTVRTGPQPSMYCVLGVKQVEREVSTHLHVVSRLRMGGAVGLHFVSNTTPFGELCLPSHLSSCLLCPLLFPSRLWLQFLHCLPSLLLDSNLPLIARKGYGKGNFTLPLQMGRHKSVSVVRLI
jgi:hypothetical protein